jgi:FkbM family methyltransferase
MRKWTLAQTQEKIELYKAQFGEDRLLEKFFAGKQDGCYVEVGACDGVYASNTFYFEQIGWHGLLIEAVPELAEACRVNRPNSKTICCVVSSPDAPPQVEFEVVEGWEALSSLSVCRERLYSYQPNIRKISVPTRTLDSILEDSGLDQIDFVTIDVEGYEHSVLAGFTIGRWRPQVVILESWQPLPDRKIMHYMHENSYKYWRTTGGINHWYLRCASGAAHKLGYRLQLFATLYVSSYTRFFVRRAAKLLKNLLLSARRQNK